MSNVNRWSYIATARAAKYAYCYLWVRTSNTASERYLSPLSADYMKLEVCEDLLKSSPKTYIPVPASAIANSTAADGCDICAIGRIAEEFAGGSFESAIGFGIKLSVHIRRPRTRKGADPTPRVLWVRSRDRDCWQRPILHWQHWYAGLWPNVPFASFACVQSGESIESSGLMQAELALSRIAT